eukprot:2852746-Rhodomonas_salina.1
MSGLDAASGVQDSASVVWGLGLRVWGLEEFGFRLCCGLVASRDEADARAENDDDDEIEAAGRHWSASPT